MIFIDFIDVWGVLGVCLGCAGGVCAWGVRGGGGCLGCAWGCLGVLGGAWGVLGGAKLSCQTFMVDEGEEGEENKSALIDHRLSPMVLKRQKLIIKKF